MGDLVYTLPIAALLLIIVAAISNKIEAYFESKEDEEYESNNYQDEER